MPKNHPPSTLFFFFFALVVRPSASVAYHITCAATQTVAQPEPYIAMSIEPHPHQIPGVTLMNSPHNARFAASIGARRQAINSPGAPARERKVRVQADRSTRKGPQYELWTSGGPLGINIEPDICDFQSRGSMKLVDPWTVIVVIVEISAIQRPFVWVAARNGHPEQTARSRPGLRPARAHQN